MESLIQKYMDGDLSEEESQRFLDAVEADPALNREVRALEELVEHGSRVKPLAPSSDFTDGVMGAIRDQDAPRTARPRWTPAGLSSRAALVPLAASWVLALGLGYVLSQGLLGRPGDGQIHIADGTPALMTANTGVAPIPSLRMVRLVYAPEHPDVSRVRVAGSFNDWNPDRTPMHLEDGRWVAALVLPPDSYEYMFVIDDDTWVTDPLALTTRDDGFGSKNAVLELRL